MKLDMSGWTSNIAKSIKDAVGVKGSVKGMEDANKQTAKSFSTLGNSIESGTRSAVRMFSTLVGGTASVYGLYRAVNSSIDSFVKLEDSFANVKKTVDGSRGQIEALRQELLALANRVPIGTTDLFDIAAAAGQLGIASKNIGAFTEVIAQFAASTNVGAQEAATELARWVNVTGLAQSKIGNLASTINLLGNTMAANEREIIEFGSRLTGAGRLAGLADSDIAALASTLASLQLDPEASGTAFSKLLQDMQSAVMGGGDNLKLFAALARQSVDEFSQAFKADAMAALQSFLSGMDDVRVSGGNLYEVLEALGIQDQRMVRAVTAVALGHDQLSAAVKSAATEMVTASSLQDEFNKRLGTAASELQKIENRTVAASAKIGEMITPGKIALYGSWADLLTTISNNMRSIGSFMSLPGPLVPIGQWLTKSVDDAESFSAIDQLGAKLDEMLGAQAAINEMNTALERMMETGKAALTITTGGKDNTFMAAIQELIKALNGEGGAAAKKLAQLQDAAANLYNELVPVSGLFTEFNDKLGLLQKFGLGTDEAIANLGRDLFGKFSDSLSSSEKAQFIQDIVDMGDEAGKKFAQSFGESWTNEIAMMESKMMEGVFDTEVSTVQTDAAKAAKEQMQRIQSELSFVAQGFSAVGNALSSATDKFKGLTKVLQGAQIAVNLVGIGMDLAAKIAKFSAATMRQAWESALGIIGLVLEAVYQLINAFGLLGNNGEKELKGIAKVIDEVKQASTAWIDDLADRIVKFARTGEATFQEFVDSVLDDLARIALTELFLNPIVDFASDIIPGFAKGGVFDKGRVTAFARGGVLPGPTLAPMALMGEAGPEAVMPLSRGRDGRLGVAASGAGNVSVQVHNYSGAQSETRESVGPDGTRNIEVIIRNTVRKSLRNGEFNRDFAGLYGLTRRPV